MSREKSITLSTGWGMLAFTLLLYAAAIVLFLFGVILVERDKIIGLPSIFSGVACFIVACFLAAGFITLLPNEACLFTLFGSYIGTARDSGFWWANPFMSKRKLSLRAHNLEGARLKVNDKLGNPIEIAAVVVWRVEDTFAACFEVENYADYVRVQSETAVRHLANSYAYDHGEEHETTLRSGIDDVSQALRAELQERLAPSGVHVDEARLTHLAYAPEIAQAMLRRQQAEAIIAARQKIVHGAVSMVQMALQELSDKKVVELDEDRKASMVSNLLVVLCGEAEVHPVINTGTLHN